MVADKELTIGLALDAGAVTRDTFPLPGIQAQLEKASLDVHRGRGFAIVRGLGSRKYTAEDNVTIFLAIANYIGEQRGVQDKKGSMLSTACPSLNLSSSQANPSISPCHGLQGLDHAPGDATWNSYNHGPGRPPLLNDVVAVLFADKTSYSGMAL